MKTLIVALYAYGIANGHDGWIDHGAATTYGVVKDKADFLDLKTCADKNDLIEKLRGYDLVAFGMKSAHYPIGMELIDAAKTVGAKTLVAGMHTAAAPEELLENPLIDYVFYGESEITFSDFLDHPDSYGRQIQGEAPTDLDALSYIDRELFREPLESPHGWRGFGSMASFVSARSCPFHCTFCQPAERKHFGSQLRMRSVDHLIGEMEEVVERYNPDMLMVHDDMFLIKPKHVAEFIEKYPKVGKPFWAASRADWVCRNEDLVMELGRVGLSILSIGFESGSQRILDMVKKGTTVAQNIEAARIAKAAGAHIYGNFILGFPTETREEAMATMKMADEIQAEIGSWAFFAPYPGTELGNHCIEQGLSLLNRDSYNRYPSPKLKGIDYGYLNQIMGGLRT